MRNPASKALFRTAAITIEVDGYTGDRYTREFSNLSSASGLSVLWSVFSAACDACPSHSQIERAILDAQIITLLSSGQPISELYF
jgi:hypothetical protein